MRKVLTCNLTSEMCLARPVFFQNKLLLNRGVCNLNKYSKLLANMGIYSLYIEDSISEGIDAIEILSEKTMRKCRGALQNVFEKFQKTGCLETADLTNSSTTILDELLCREDILVSLDNLGTTDANTLSHSLNVTIYSLLLGTKLGYSRSRLQLLAEGAMLHDIGKTVLDQKILFKPGKLTAAEFNHVKHHTSLGYEILKENSFMSAVTKNIALYHHERLDGSGYPEGISKDSIHDFSRIVAIADIYDALTMDRCYHKALRASDAIRILREDAGSKLDHEFVEKFINQLAVYPNGSLVRLSDRRIGIVKCQNRHLPFRPVVRILFEADDTKVVPYEMDLAQTLAVKIVDEAVEL